MTDQKEDLNKLIKAITELTLGLESIIRLAQSKQRQRAEPWQESVLEIARKTLTYYEQIMKD